MATKACKVSLVIICLHAFLNTPSVILFCILGFCNRVFLKVLLNRLFQNILGRNRNIFMTLSVKIMGSLWTECTSNRRQICSPLTCCTCCDKDLSPRQRRDNSFEERCLLVTPVLCMCVYTYHLCLCVFLLSFQGFGGVGLRERVN